MVSLPEENGETNMISFSHAFLCLWALVMSGDFHTCALKMVEVSLFVFMSVSSSVQLSLFYVFVYVFMYIFVCGSGVFHNCALKMVEVNVRMALSIYILICLSTNQYIRISL